MNSFFINLITQELNGKAVQFLNKNLLNNRNFMDKKIYQRKHNDRTNLKQMVSFSSVLKWPVKMNVLPRWQNVQVTMAKISNC